MRLRGTRTEGVFRITGHTDRTGLLGAGSHSFCETALILALPPAPAHGCQTTDLTSQACNGEAGGEAKHPLNPYEVKLVGSTWKIQDSNGYLTYYNFLSATGECYNLIAA